MHYFEMKKKSKIFWEGISTSSGPSPRCGGEGPEGPPHQTPPPWRIWSLDDPPLLFDKSNTASKRHLSVTLK